MPLNVFFVPKKEEIFRECAIDTWFQSLYSSCVHHEITLDYKPHFDNQPNREEVPTTGRL